MLYRVFAVLTMIIVHISLITPTPRLCHSRSRFRLITLNQPRHLLTWRDRQLIVNRVHRAYHQLAHRYSSSLVDPVSVNSRMTSFFGACAGTCSVRHFCPPFHRFPPRVTCELSATRMRQLFLGTTDVMLVRYTFRISPVFLSGSWTCFSPQVFITAPVSGAAPPWLHEARYHLTSQRARGPVCSVRQSA